jgi:hypothetical protein
MLLFLLLQAAAAEPAGLPDIELNVRARVRSVEIERKGEAKLEVRAEPDAGSLVRAEATPKAEGRTKLNNVDVNVRAEVRLGDPSESRTGAETTAPQ